MNRLYAFIIVSAFLTVAEAKDVVIRISNSTDIQRHELVELDAVRILAEAGLDKNSLVVKNRKGQILTLQYTYDGKLLFDASVRPHSFTEYTVTRGVPVVDNVWVKGRHVPERKDDIAWENDRCAYRLYGPALQKTGEKAFGIDIWVKNTPELVVDERYALDISGFQETMRLKAAGKEEEAKENGLATSFHVDRGRGYDPYKVGSSLGCGTPALLLGDSLVMPYCWKEYEILDNGPLRFTIALTYCKAKDGSTEHRIISLDKGSNFNKMTVWYENLPQTTDVVGGVVVHEEDSQHSPLAETMWNMPIQQTISLAILHRYIQHVCSQRVWTRLRIFLMLSLRMVIQDILLAFIEIFEAMSVLHITSVLHGASMTYVHRMSGVCV